MTNPSAYSRIVAGYHVVGRIRRGPESTVYHAIRTSDGTAVALKVLRTVLSNEPAAMRPPTHPHIIPVYETGRALDGRPYVAMEYRPDGSYQDLLQRSGPIDVEEAVSVGIAIADALHATHDAGVIHRDVSPGNLLRGANGPVLTDFGIAAAPNELANTVALDRLTPPHAAPEALLRRAQSAPSDVYSLASTLWTLLAGHPPFAEPGETSPDPFEYRERALREPVPPVPDPAVPDWLQAVLRKAMQKEPERRYQTAKAFGDALRNQERPADIAESGAPDNEETSAGDAPPAGEASSGEAQPQPTYAAWPAQAEPQPAREAPTAHGTPHGAHQAPSAAQKAPSAPAPALAPPNAARNDGWWHAGEPSPPLSTPQWYPDEPAGRRGGPTLAIVCTVLTMLLLLGLGGYVLYTRLSTGSAQQPAAQPARSGPIGRSPSPTPNPAPQGVQLTDERVAVTLTWHDPTAGAAAFSVVGAPAGGTAATLANAGKGRTTVRVNGLNPDVEYCFVVVAVLSVDDVARSDQICTQRFATGSPSAGAQPSRSAR